MRNMRTRAPRVLVLMSLCFSAFTVMGQMPPSPVEFVTVKQHSLHAAVKLTGTVRSQKAGTMASSTAGIVAERLVEEGQRVRRGQPLVKLNAGPAKLVLKTAEAGIAENKARLAKARQDLKRAESLFKNSISTKERLEQAQTEVEALDNTVKRLSAQANEVRDMISRMTVLSSIDGIVVQLHTEVGQWVNAGGPVADVASLEDMEVLVQVPERFFNVLTGKAAALVRFPALGNLELEAEPPVLIPHQTGTARTFPARIPFKPNGQLIPAGMLAEVSLKASGSSTELIIPKDGIVNNGNGFFIYTIGEGEAVAQVPITPGEAVGQWIAISGDLSAGDRVVTRGNERLMPGQVVVPTEATGYELPKP